MRIEAYHQIQQIYQPGKVSKVRQPGSASQARGQLQFSSLGRDIRVAQTAISQTPDVREDLTASIKARIQNGTYSVDSAAFAEKLMRNYEEMRKEVPWQV